MTIQKPRAELQLSVPKWGTRDEFITIYPRLIKAKWTRNNHLVADVLTATIGWKEGGVDPRQMKNARAAFFMWDAMTAGELTPDGLSPFLRFTGIATKAKRSLDDSGQLVELEFLDYTTMFINMKPFPSAGMPEWSDTLLSTWQKVCDNTGFKDPASGKIVSSVTALRENLDIRVTEFETATLGDVTASRFHAISKPSPPHNADAWTVWQYCIGMLGLISYIDGDSCVVTNTTEHYGKGKAPNLIYGQNILTFEEESDSSITTKGVLLKSFDHLEGRVLEAVYPPPGDDRLKTSRAVAKRALKENRDPSLNELSADYEEFEVHEITNQEALERKAEEVYEERKRQEMTGKIKTRDMFITDSDGALFDLLDIRSGDPVRVAIDPETKDALVNIGGASDQVRYLVDHLGYDEGLAKLIVANIDAAQLKSPVFHMKQLDVEIGPEQFEIELSYHNLIIID